MNEQKIIIQEVGRPELPKPKLNLKLDLQDYLLIAGVLSGEAACYLIWRPAALILCFVLCFTFAYLIEKSKPKDKRGATR